MGSFADDQRGSASDRQVLWFCPRGADRGIILRLWMGVLRVTKVTVMDWRPSRRW